MKTRWNSTLAMLRSVVKHKADLRALSKLCKDAQAQQKANRETADKLPKIVAKIDSISEADFAFGQELCDSLSIFYDATVMVRALGKIYCI